MIAHLRSVGCSALLAISFLPAWAQDSGLIATTDDQGVMITDDDRPALFYQRSTKSINDQFPRAGYVHPLFDLNGQALTEDFPSDHRHHRGIFWAWHQVWVGDHRLGDPWLCKDFAWDVKSTRVKQQDGGLEITAVVDWNSSEYIDDSSTPIAVVRDTTTITVHGREPTFRIVDFDISLLALIDGVRIGGSKDDKGYGGFSPKIKLSVDQTFRATSGEVEPTITAIDAGPWVDVRGPTSGISMISHSKNPGKPGQCLLRRSRSRQDAVYPGRNPV